MSTLERARMGDGCHIAWRLDGRPGAPVLMLSNSLGTTMEMWVPQMDAFAAHYRVLRYDSRGHGASDVPDGSYSIDRLGRDAVELLDGLGVGRVHFCGLSMGGMVGQWLACRAPDRLCGLVLANTSAFMGPPASWDARIGAIQEDGMEALAQAVLERWFTPRFLAGHGDRVAELRAMLLATKPVGYTGCCAAIRDMDLRPVLPLIKRPTLVIAGDADSATPLACSEEIANAAANARLAVLSTAHLSNIERPDDFSKAVLHHLK